MSNSPRWTIADLIEYKQRTGKLAGDQKHSRAERKEAELQAACEAILRARGIWYLHISKAKGNKVGVPDILLCLSPSGKFVGVELKTKSKMKKEQLENQAHIRACGGIAEVCYSEQEFVNILNNNTQKLSKSDEKSGNI